MKNIHAIIIYQLKKIVFKKWNKYKTLARYVNRKRAQFPEVDKLKENLC